MLRIAGVRLEPRPSSARTRGDLPRHGLARARHGTDWRGTDWRRSSSARTGAETFLGADCSRTAGSRVLSRCFPLVVSRSIRWKPSSLLRAGYFQAEYSLNLSSSPRTTTLALLSSYFSSPPITPMFGAGASSNASVMPRSQPSS